MNRPSTLAVFGLFLRTAVRRALNMSAYLQRKAAQKAKAARATNVKSVEDATGADVATTGRDAPRAGTLGKSTRQSAGGRLIGLCLAFSMLFGGVMLSSMGLITIVESVRLDDMGASSRIRLSADDYELLATAASKPEAERDAATTETLDRIAGSWTGTWTKDVARGLVQKKLSDEGMAGFEKVADDSSFRGDLAMMSPASRTRALRAAGLFAMLISFGSMGLALGAMNRSLAGTDPVLGWLLQFPVSRRALFAARLAEQTFDTPLAVLNFVLGSIVMYLCGTGFWSGVGCAALFGVSSALFAASLRLGLEAALIRFCRRKLRGSLVATICLIGNFILLFAMLGSGAAATTRGLIWLADKAPAVKFINPWAPGFGSATFLSEQTATWAVATLAMSVAAGWLAVWLTDRLTRDGLMTAADSGRGAKASNGSKTTTYASKTSPWATGDGLLQGLLAKEWLHLVRKPELIFHVIFAPLLVLGILYFKDPEKSLNLMTRDAGTVCVSIFLIAGYVLLGAAGSLLMNEFRLLWMLQTLPRSLADVVRTKARFWGAIVLAPVVGLTIWALVASPDRFGEIGLRAPFLLAFVWLLAEVCFGAIALGLSISPDNLVRVRRSVWFLPLIVSGECAAALFLGSFWSLAGTLVIVILIAGALRDRQIAALPWIGEPVDDAPRRVDAAHALITLGAFLQLREMSGRLLTLTSLSAVEAVWAAFAASAAVVAVVFLLWRHQSETEPLPAMRPGAFWRPTLAGFALAAAVGVAWIGVLQQTSVAAAARTNLRLPASVDQLDLEAWLRLAGLLVVAPLFEEWLFRGLLFRSLRQTRGLVVSVALTALLFTVIHPMESVVGVLTLAVVTSCAYEKTGRLIAPILIHFGYNLTVMALWTAWPT